MALTSFNGACGSDKLKARPGYPPTRANGGATPRGVKVWWRQMGVINELHMATPTPEEQGVGEGRGGAGWGRRIIIIHLGMQPYMSFGAR